MIKIFFSASLILLFLNASAQLDCSQSMITTPDTTVCKGQPVSLKALKRKNQHSVRFDGINDYIVVLNNPSLNVDTAFTIECWYKPDTLGFYYLISKGPDSTVGWYALGRYPASAGNTYFGGTRESSQNVHIDVGPPMNPPSGQWVHLCYSGNNTVRRLYINGLLEVETSGYISFPQNSYNLNIGRQQYTAYPYYARGWMDELRIWKRTLSQQEINDKMQKKLKASEENLLSLYYDFNDGSGFIVSDKSGNNNYGVLTNGVEWSNDVPFTDYSNDYTYHWSTGDSTQTITYNIPSSVVVSLIVTDNNTTCYDTVHINVFAGPVATSSATSFCQGDSAILTTANANSYLWSTGDTTQSIVVYITGQYQVSVNDTNGCNSPSNVISITENMNPTPTIYADGPTLFCMGQHVTLSTVYNYQSYLWSNGSSSGILDISSSGVFTVTVTDENGCTGQSTEMDVSVVPAVNTSSIVGPVNVSAFIAYNYTVTQTPGNTYSWSITNGAISSGQGTNSISVLWNDNTSGQLTVVESNGVCSDTAYLNIIIFNSIANIESLPAQIYPNPCHDLIFIKGETDAINITYRISDIQGRYLMSGNIKSGHSISVRELNPGTYILHLTDGAGRTKIIQFVKMD